MIKTIITDDDGYIEEFISKGSVPTDNDIEKASKGYDNAMSSMSESIWMPAGFIEGAKWMRKKLTGK